MQAWARREVPAAFFDRIRDASQRVLITDFDGTLAPFEIERDKVLPFDGVQEWLARIVEEDRTRLVVVSGRPVAEVEALLGLAAPLEIWGDHGWERRLPSGRIDRIPIPPLAEEALAEIRRSSFACFCDVVETKRAGLAFHWRGLSVGTATIAREWAMGFGAASPRGVLRLVEFDGGVEVRVPGRTKGDAVHTVLDDVGDESVAAAYLGDDVTDEDAFRAIHGRGLGFLVRPEARITLADCWLRPPGDVLQFLDRWHRSCQEGG